MSARYVGERLWLADGGSRWGKAGTEVKVVEVISPQRFHARVLSNGKVYSVDTALTDVRILFQCVCCNRIETKPECPTCGTEHMTKEIER